jgi:hypothetical protein
VVFLASDNDPEAVNPEITSPGATQ